MRRHVQVESDKRFFTSIKAINKIQHVMPKYIMLLIISEKFCSLILYISPLNFYQKSLSKSYKTVFLSETPNIKTKDRHNKSAIVSMKI